MTLAKSIGGGLPLAAFGGKREVMEVVVDGRMAHFGTYNGNALCMAAAEAVDELCTHEALAAAEQVNLGALEAIDTVIDEYELPAHTVGWGSRAASPGRPARCATIATTRPPTSAWPNCRLWGVNRGILTPPGLDEQWLVSLANTTTDMDQLVGRRPRVGQALRG